jgi:hypothetical protein
MLSKCKIKIKTENVRLVPAMAGGTLQVTSKKLAKSSIPFPTYMANLFDTHVPSTSRSC